MVQTVTVQRLINAPVADVFDAWLNAASARKWLFATPAGEMVQAEMDGCVGGALVFVDRREGVDVRHEGQYLLIERPSRLRFQFRVPQFSPDYTVIDLTFGEVGGKCGVTLAHAGVLEAFAERTKQGWAMILANLAKAFEG